MSWSTWWIALALIALFAPGAAAQVEGPYLEVSVTPHGTPLEPITGEGQATVDVTVKCDVGAVYDELAALQVTLEAETEKDWLVAVLQKASFQVEMAPTDCAAGFEKKETVQVALFASRDAPALDLSMVTFTAAISQGDAVTESWNETAGVFLKVKTRLEKTVQEARSGQEVVFPMTVSNHGNGAIRATFTPNANTSEELQVQIPEPIEVDAGKDGTVDVKVVAPTGLLSEVATLSVIIDVAAVDDTSLTGQEQVSALVRGHVLSEESPLSSFASLVIVLALVALVHRYR